MPPGERPRLVGVPTGRRPRVKRKCIGCGQVWEPLQDAEKLCPACKGGDTNIDTLKQSYAAYDRGWHLRGEDGRDALGPDAPEGDPRYEAWCLGRQERAFVALDYAPEAREGWRHGWDAESPAGDSDAYAEAYAMGRQERLTWNEQGGFR